MQQPTLYGIANCDTMRKARKWLDARAIDYRFHDYRKQGLSREILAPVLAHFGWEALLNRRGTTWRRLPDEMRADLDRDRALAIMLEHPAIIRRPLLQLDTELILGFDEARYAEAFAQT